jgi:hypothetical protein
MLYLTRLAIKSFVPREDGGRAASEVPSALLEPGAGAQEQQALQQLERAKYFAACYLALRGYYGDHALPPPEALQAFIQGDETPVYRWYGWVEQVMRTSTSTIFGPGDEFGQYVEVENPRGSCDLLIFSGRLEIFFRQHPGRQEDDSGMRERLFQPLLAFFAEAALSIEQLDAEVTFVDEAGLHCAPLTSLLRGLGLLASPLL